MVGQDRYVAVVQAGDKYLLIGVTSQQISLLQELDPEDLIPLAPIQGNSTPKAQEFRELLNKFGKMTQKGEKKMYDSLINVNGNQVPTLEILLLLTIVALLPSLIIMMTSFSRTVIILSFLRNALGIQQAPPNMVLVGISLFLTLFIMDPVIKEINTEAYEPYKNQQITQEEALERAQVPLKEFMLKQTEKSSLNLYMDMADVQLAEDESPEDLSMTVIVPAFMTSELKRAFVAGFLLFIPFLLIDIIVSSTLMSMGMIMLPPAMISLPFKLLLFITVDGWNLLFSTIVKSFR